MFINRWMDKDVVYKHNGILLLFSHAVVSDFLWLHGLQHARPPCPLKFAQIHVHCIGDTIQPFHPLTPSSLSALHLSQHHRLFQWVICSIRWPKYWSFSFSISPSNEYLGLISLKIGSSPCCPRDSQESSPAPQFKGINSLELWLLYGSALTNVHYHWQDHSLDYTDLCPQSNVCFSTWCLGLS